MSQPPPRRRVRGILGVLVATIGAVAVATPAHAATLTTVSGFGSNPGNLTMYSYRPDGLPAGAPVVVLLHGCVQNATTYVTNSGWRKYADLWGFGLIAAEQKSANNALSCFNWFQAGDIARGQGEALSIKQMIDHGIASFGYAPGRVYVSGLSAGGAMAAVMLATYPDVFAGGSVVAGIPYNCGTTCQSMAVSKTPQQWGNLVRAAYPGYAGPWPRVSIWQGQSDTTVVPANATELMTQWTNVHGVSQTPTATSSLPAGTTVQRYGDDVVRVYTVSGMAHGTPVDPGSALDQCGTAASYFLDTICSAYRDAVAFGLDATTVPAAPTGLTVTGTTHATVSLAWTAAGGATGYHVYRGGTRITSTPVSTTTYTDTGLAASTTYSYTVRAVNSAGEGPASASVAVTTSATPPPGPSAPTGLTVTATTDTSVSLVWTAVSGATGYRVYRGGALVASVAATSYTDTGRSPATTYQYRVSAVNGSGVEGPQSTVVSATTTTVVCVTASNYAHVQAGRAYQSLGSTYANGSNQAMGLYNTFYTHALKQTGPNYWIVADGQC